MKTPRPVCHDIGVRSAAAVGRVEGPPGIHAAGDHRVHREREADDEDIPAQKIEPRKRDVLGAEHQRQHEVAENRRHGWDQDEEHHRHAVHREQLVVGVGRHQIAGGRGQFETDAGGEEAAEEEGERHDQEVHDADALVVLGQEPRGDTRLMVQIGDRRSSNDRSS
jgi:hypothetical protein